MVIAYTTTGGTKAVSWTHMHQMVIIMSGMAVALAVAIHSLPSDVTLLDAVHVAGRMGRLNAIDFSFDLTTNYTFWSGLVGGCFLALSYFGTDQSQVQRYLTGETTTQSRLGLLFNGMVKVPMQFFILFVGAMVFVFYQFVTPPLVFNTAERTKIRVSQFAPDYTRLEAIHERNAAAKQADVRSLVAAMRNHDDARIAAATAAVRGAQERENATRKQTADLLRMNDPKADTTDTNYVFLTFVIRFLPAGLVGLVLAAIFCASMSSTASGLNSLASTSVVDLYRRFVAPKASEHEYVRVSRIMTLFWGFFAIGFAEFANRLGSLIEAVNKLGSLFYGTILGIFLLAFYVKEVGGTAAFIGAIVGEAAVVWCSLFTNLAYLWWNVIGCVVGVAAAIVVERMLPAREAEAVPSS
jgi:SSS family solute:Na+ symporter